MNMENAITLQVLLVDDERLARKRLSDLLSGHPEVRIVGEASDLNSARARLQEQMPDVVFLDIDLSPGCGFDLLPDLPAETEVVFITAHDTFAVRAFEANALDYLLKPVAPDRLVTSMERLLARRRTERNPEAPAALPDQIGRLTPTAPLLVRDGRTWLRLQPRSVAAIQGEGTYSRLHLAEGNSILVLRTLNQWMDMLPESHFVRLSRSLLVNIRLVERLETLSRDRAELHLVGWSRSLRLGRVAARQLRQVLVEETGGQESDNGPSADCPTHAKGVPTA